jgi:hypothetical protein
MAVKEVIMKRVILALAIFSALALSSGSLLSTGKVQAADNERAVVEFKETVKLFNVLLKGEYIIVHDDSRMAQGMPCLSVYSNSKPDKLVVAFHCKPVARDKADHFKVIASRRTWFEVPEVFEIQFQGATKGHQVQ